MSTESRCISEFCERETVCFITVSQSKRAYCTPHATKPTKPQSPPSKGAAPRPSTSTSSGQANQHTRNGITCPFHLDDQQATNQQHANQTTNVHHNIEAPTNPTTSPRHEKISLTSSPSRHPASRPSPAIITGCRLSACRKLDRPRHTIRFASVKPQWSPTLEWLQHQRVDSCLRLSRQVKQSRTLQVTLGRAWPTQVRAVRQRTMRCSPAPQCNCPARLRMA
jgi:hypothetical protein